MKTVSMLEFRKNAMEIVKGVQRGQRVVLTYRGEPVARLEPPESSRQAVLSSRRERRRQE